MKHYQTGSTMISLMIGLLISLLCLIALVTIFRAVMVNSVDSRQSSKQQTQIYNGFTVAQILAQSAGFGFSSGTNVLIAPNPLQLDGGITVDNRQSALWRYYSTLGNTNTLTCQGIASIINNDQNKLVVLKTAADGCAQTASLNSLKWSVDRVLAVLPSTATIAFALTTELCTPYGVGKVANHPKLTISANSTNFPICLSNITS